MSKTPTSPLHHEIGPDGLARESPVIAYTEMIIEAEQLQLKKYIEENYSRIRDVERELASLNFELKLTAGPKKAALELIRKKIETSTEKIRLAKLKEEQARKAWEESSKVVKDEEAVKQQLCEDLNRLVQEGSNTQFSRLEELKRRLEAMNPSKSSSSDVHDVKITEHEKNITPNEHSSNKPIAENVHNQGNTTVANGQNQQPLVEGEGRAKKKLFNPGRGKGNSLVLKGRGSSNSGWTGSGFDVDAKS